MMRARIKEAFAAKSTEELQKIHTEQDADRWSEETFEVVLELLREREVDRSLISVNPLEQLRKREERELTNLLESLAETSKVLKIAAVLLLACVIVVAFGSAAHLSNFFLWVLFCG